MKYLILQSAPAYVPPVMLDGEEPPTPPTQAELNVRYAREISERIWALKNPNPPAGTKTRGYTGWVQHEDGRVALQVHGEAIQQELDGETVTTFTDMLRVDPDGDENALVDSIGDAVTAAESAAMRGNLAAVKGSGASLLAFAMATPSLAVRLKTQSEMEADGWFTEI